MFLAWWSRRSQGDVGSKIARLEKRFRNVELMSDRLVVSCVRMFLVE